MSSSEDIARREIERLIYRYAELQDGADWEAMAELFAHGEFEGTAGVSWNGQEIAERRRVYVITYDDGTPRTRHVTTNLAIDIDDARETATAESYYTIIQGPPALSLQPIATGRYIDRFERVDDCWCFTYRRSHMDLLGRFGGFRRDSSDWDEMAESSGN